MRKVRVLELLGLVLVTLQHPSLASAEDYVPQVPKDYAPQVPKDYAPQVLKDYAPQDYVPNNCVPAPPATTPVPGSEAAPGWVQQPSGFPPSGSGLLQGQVQQTQRFVPGIPGAATTTSPTTTMPPGAALFPGYVQQQGTAPGGIPYAQAWQLGNPMQGRPAPNQVFPLATQQTPLSGRVQDKTQKPNGRPTWLPAYAYSNDAMVAPYHNLDIFFWDKRPIPNRKQWMKLSTSVSRYWNGYVPDPCMILAIPIDQAPGNFTFQASEPGAPRGWLQNTGESNWQGFPLYRYWFDQR